MKAVVVYESLWGNTAAVARAIAAGIGPDTAVLDTTAATGDAIAGADLIVAGAPVLGFRLPSEQMRNGLTMSERNAPKPPDLSHPSMRSWLQSIAPGHGRCAAFETRLRWTPGGATGAIERGLAGAGYPAVAKAGHFVVKGRYGPLRDGELDRARQWGAQLAHAME